MLNKILGRGIVGAPIIEKVVFNFDNLQPELHWEQDGKTQAAEIIGVKDSITNATISSLHIELKGERMAVVDITPKQKEEIANYFALSKKMQKYV